MMCIECHISSRPVYKIKFLVRNYGEQDFPFLNVVLILVFSHCEHKETIYLTKSTSSCNTTYIRGIISCNGLA